MAGATVKQAELTRYIKALLAAGVEIGEVRIAPDGSVVMVPLGAVSTNACEPFDQWQGQPFGAGK